MTTLSVLLQSEISDFFASFGGRGAPDIQSGEAQRQLIDRVLSVVASQQAATVPDAWTWEQAREFVRREDISFPVEAAYSAVKSFWAASQQAPAANPQIAEYERIEQTDAARVARAALDYIDAIPAEVAASLPAMPGFDRDWAESVIAAVAKPEAGAALDARLKAAGMSTVANVLAGQPIDGFIRHAGVVDLQTLAQWAEMRRAEYLRMLAPYQLCERPFDDMYEWVVSHAGAFSELHVNVRAVLDNQTTEPDTDTAPEPLYTCPACGEQSYEDLGGGCLRCADCSHQFTKLEGKP